MHEIISPRGFRGVQFRDSHGNLCTVSQSSATDLTGQPPGASFLWVGVVDAHPQILQQDAVALGLMDDPGGQLTGWVDYTIPEEVLLHTQMHLSRKQVAELIQLLSSWLETNRFSEEATDG